MTCTSSERIGKPNELRNPQSHLEFFNFNEQTVDFLTEKLCQWRIERNKIGLIKLKKLYNPLAEKVLLLNEASSFLTFLRWQIKVYLNYHISPESQSKEGEELILNKNKIK